MAGAGYKLFNTGDVLTAAQVNTYLNEQTVMVFADSAARTTALSGVLAEGMVSYLQDTNAVEVYNGSAWVGVSGAGDVTEVQAGTGISVASGTGPIPVVTNTMATAVDAKGDLIVGTGADTFARLAVGTNGHTLVADSSVSPTGLKWAAPSSTPDFKGFSAYLNTAQTPTASVFTKLAFSAENFDTEGWFDTSLYRFTPTTAGYYKIDVMVMPNSTARCRVDLYKNGNTLTRTIDQQVAASLSGTYSAPFYSNGTDYWEVYIFQAATSGPMQLGLDLSVFSATYLGA